MIDRKFIVKRSPLSYLVLGVVLLATIALGGFAFFRVNAPTPTASAIPSGGNLAVSSDERTKVVVYGDSISVGDSPAFSSQQLGKRAWPYYLSENGVYFIGGYAMGGATTGNILEQNRCQSGLRAPVTVAAFGTNSLQTGESFEANLLNLERLKSECNAELRPEAFIVTAVGPGNTIPQEKVTDWNARLKAAAEQRGWTFADPFSGMRTPENTWLPGLSFDGLHPTEAAAKTYAANIAPVIISAGKQSAG